MKKQNAFLLAAIILSLSLSSCRQSNPKIINYYIDDNNHLIVMYDNGKTEDVGHLSDEDIATYINAITISQDGFFIINGIKTSIRVTFNSVTISEDGYYVIDGIKTSIKAGIDSITISDDGYYVVNGIKTNIKATEVYTVRFITGYSATVPNQQVFEGHKVERPQLSRTGYDLEGWFCNGEEWRFNSDVVLNDMTLVAEWEAKQYTISFVNEKGDAPADMTVTFDSNYTLPTVSTVTGYTFAGWYSGSTKYNGGKWTTASNITLTAKWTAKTYTVTLDPGVGSVSKTTQNIVYGQNYTLPVPTNSYGVFVGWLCDGEVVTDNQGRSLLPWAYTENKTFTVDWEIKIYTANDLASMSIYPNAAFKLMNDIDLGGVTWIPVGTVNSMFKGTFDGNGFSIKNLSFNTATQELSTYGLFGYVDGATIKNLWIKDFSFTSQNVGRSYAIGSIFAVTLSNNTTIVNNCKATGSYSIAAQSSTYEITAGGFAGEAYAATFTNCINEISFSNAIYSGGLVGKSSSSIAISSSLNKGNILAKKVAGGFVGYAKNIYASACLNEGDVTAENIAGGFAGQSFQSTSLNKVINKGNITCTASTGDTSEGVGGLVGSAYLTSAGLSNVNIDSSYNIGEIKGSQAGGLISMMTGGIVSNSYNGGDITGYDSAGGIASNAISASFIQCLASGTLSVPGSVSKMSTIAFGVSGIEYTDCYYTYNNISNFIGKNGSYTNDYYGSSLYKDLMYWTDDYWDYSDSSFPTLKIESALAEMENSWN